MAPIQPKKKPADTIKAALNLEDEIKRKQAVSVSGGASGALCGAI